MEARVRLVLEYEQGEATMTELCRSYEISRETGYYWLRRYRGGGVESLRDLRRTPERRPNQTAAEVEQRVLELRRVHMRWGPRKLKRVLERESPEQRWPAASTMGEMLRREGLAIPRRKRRRTEPYRQPFAAADAPNRVWCADFKGWFRTRDGERIDPFTLSDAHTRYLLRCQAVEKADQERVQAICEAAFREYGLPQAIRSDNGAPFASRAVAGLSRLAVWWMKLGIVPERIAPGHPEQNGRHERMHRTLKQETAQPAAAHRRAQQKAFDRFRQEYNQVRPHEALHMRTPASCYQVSPREFPARLPEPEYGSALQVRRVQEHGEFNWKHQHVFLSEVLWGERIGLLAEDDCFYTIFFTRFPIARFDSRRLKVLPLPKRTGFYGDEAEEGELPPSPAPHPLNQNLSGMCPV
jgi:transposase InsO family protein